MPTGIYKRKPLSETHKKNISLANTGRKMPDGFGKMVSDRQLGINNPYWKGDKISYSGLHKWVTLKLGQPRYCAYCQTTTAKKYEWANISRCYRRELSDWIRLCTSCHRFYDGGKIKII